MDIKSWLRTVLQNYQDPDRTFRDVDAVLQTYLSLKPKMDTYTSNDGHTQLLLCLHGTIPITYRSIPYNIPVAFWIPKEYPKSSPIPYVKPTANMLIREGRHVDISGMCYHHYRSSWPNDQNHTFLELVAILQQVFALEPPVYTKPTNITTSTGSPQIQESILDRVSPQQRQSMPLNSQSPALSQTSPEMPRWMGESTALYNMNQGLAVSNLASRSFYSIFERIFLFLL
ncbi:UEV domain-containing protein [Mucor mucedo]|uniref:UEV domain-containing protein n=1 Tax=Mucor mucedo TaxID=29922 RepID=UPI00221FC4BD|nr:UEV domain-containing protein [Mucor mucedo]KAI7889166.1 UEV domain-containing protein [Mucor mucedo]